MEKITRSSDCIGKMVFSPLRSKTGDYIFQVNGIVEEVIDTLCQDYSYLVLSCDFTCASGKVQFDTCERIYHLLPEDELFVCPPEMAAAVKNLVNPNQVLCQAAI